ncbi:MAG: ABC transporter ATP-binding protein/permease [Clostridia bacterium]|nr:ABC transporter ATP-binding protein/permease [Clostridia bacterium]
MIELQSVNKYFNKGRRNEIHAINNTTLSLPDKGLVALLGESGCGKTTMLNAIGGLDKVRSGKIYIDGKKITRHNMHSVDRLRNLNIGYIFQDYKLMDDMTVYDNVALALKMVGIKDKEEQKVRIEYVLDKVGILRYRKRPAGTLSGGERQRVGIARALVKDPHIILADEPTGNLDSKNSVEIMNIIRKIADDRLVILVTHERNLAEFYADRIIEVIDGSVVNDYENDITKALDYEIDNVFYLKEFKNHNEFKDPAGERTVNVYDNGETKVNVNIIVKNGNIYIQSEDAVNVELIDRNSSIEVVDDYKQEINRQNISDYDFNMSTVGDQSIRRRYASMFRPFSELLAGFKKIFGFSVLRKLLLIGFLFAGFFIVFAVGYTASMYHVEPKDYTTDNSNYIVVSKPSMKADEFEKLEQRDGVEYILPTGAKKAFRIPYGDYYQTVNVTVNISGSISSTELLKKDNVIVGRLPSAKDEITIDKMILDKQFEQNAVYQMVGAKSYEKMIDRKAQLNNNMGEYKIVGVVDLQSPSIYADPSELLKIIKYGFDASEGEDMFFFGYEDQDYEDITANQITDYKLYEDKIVLTDDWYGKSRLPENDYEVLLPESMKDSFKIDKETKLKVDDQKLICCGYYKQEEGDTESLNAYFVNENMIKHQMISKAKQYTICTFDKDTLVSELQHEGYTVFDCDQKARETFDEERKEQVRTVTIIGAVILGISLIEMFLMSRSSFLSRIKEVGTLRAIGAKKLDIYRMFIGEAVAITTLTSLPAMLIMHYIMSYLTSEIKYLSDIYYMPIILLLATILVVYLFNVIVALIPVWNTMRKRPAAILARYDVD